jgi:hypothetical protein
MHGRYNSEDHGGGASRVHDLTANALTVESPESGSPSFYSAPGRLPLQWELARFVDIVFRHANKSGFIPLRAFTDKRDAPPIFTESITLDDPQFFDVVTERARQAANWSEPAVFAPPVVTFRTGNNAKTENIREGVTLPVECDEHPNDAINYLREILGNPTLIIASGGEWDNPDTGEAEAKAHAHWRLKVTTKTKQEHDKLYEARKLAAQLVGADGTAVPLVHPLRWPGGWHRKGEPRLAKIVFESENEIDLDEALGFLRDVAGASTCETGINPDKLKAAKVEYVAAALEIIANNDLSWCDWNRIGMAAWNASAGSKEGGEAYAAFSAKSPKNDPETTKARWEHYFTSPPDSIGFGTLVYLARQQRPGWAPGAGDEQPSSAPITATPYIWTAPESIPLREWLYGHRLIRQFATATVAPGGLGKSSLEITEFLAMVSGKALLGIKPVGQLRVWLWNLEDPRLETIRHIQATAKHFGLTADDLGDRLFVECGREQHSLSTSATVRSGPAAIAWASWCPGRGRGLSMALPDRC